MNDFSKDILYGALKSGRGRKKKSKFLFFFILFSLLALGVGAYLLWQRYQEGIRYYFLNDRYKEMNAALQKLVPAIREQTQESKNEIDEYKQKLETLTLDFPLDGYLFLNRGLFYAELTYAPVQHDISILTDIFFEETIGRFQFPAKISQDNWSRAVISLRKALELDIGKEQKSTVIDMLGKLYVLGGKAYALSAKALCEQDESACEGSRQLYKIFLGEDNLNWAELQKEFNKNNMDFLRAAYFIKKGSFPMGFTTLKNLLSSNPEVKLANNSLYLMGYMLGEQKKMREQLHYQKQINLEEFLPRQPWFLTELTYNLRFLGERDTATRTEEKYKKFLTQQEE